MGGTKFLEFETHQTRNLLIKGLLITLVFHVFYAAWLLVKPISHYVVQIVGDVMGTSGAFLAVALCYFTGRRAASARGYRVALFCSLGILCYALQQIYIIFPDLAHHPAPIPQLYSDLLAMVSYPLLLCGIWQLPRPSRSLSSHLRISLDGLMVMVTAFTFSWYFILGPSFFRHTQSLEMKIFSTLFPLMDLLLVASLLMLGGRSRRLRPVLTLFAIGLGIVVISDTVSAYLALHGKYAALTLLDISWTLGFMPIGIAAAIGKTIPPDIGQDIETAPTLWKSLLPYALLPLLAALVLSTQHVPGRIALKQGVVWGAVALIALILVRQVLAIRENWELNRKLSKLATTDSLTGLLNHRIFHKRLAEEAEKAEREGYVLAVVVLDLDNFKFFNDAYGHLAGDEVLKQVAFALHNLCGCEDTAARFGGDEFALLIPLSKLRMGQSTESLQIEISVSLSSLGYSPTGHESSIPLAISIGIAAFPGDATSRLEVMEIADTRLRRSKTGASDGLGDELLLFLTRSVTGFSMLNALVTAVDNKDRYTRRHSEDVLFYSAQIALRMGLGDAALHRLKIAALLHDVGKIGIPDAILRKPGRLTTEEFEAVQYHPVMGASIVGAVPGFEDTLDVVRYHHERWDGLGYPCGLRGDETPFLARLVAVADAFSAMTTDRPYRKGMDRGTALAILAAGAGIQWDPECVAALLEEYQSVVIPTPSVITRTDLRNMA